MSKRVYYISRNEAFTGKKPLRVEYEYPPPCLFCGHPITDEELSTDGPLVCPSCDCGRNRDGGGPWTPEQNNERWAHLRKEVNRIIQLQE